MADTKSLHLNDLMYVYFRDSVDEMKLALQNLTEVSVDTGVADAGSTVNQLDDAAKSWPVNAFQDLIIEITKGTGVGDLRKIASNTATAVLPTTAFSVAPDGTSEYRIAFYGKMASDITHWGGTALTGRDVSLDLKALTDDGIKGILKTLGDIGVGDNIATILAVIETVSGLVADVPVGAGDVGTISAKLRSISRDLVANIVLATGSNIIGKVNANLTQSDIAFLSAPWATNIAAGATTDFSTEGTNAGIDISETGGEVSITLEVSVDTSFGARVDVSFLVSRDGVTWDTHGYETLSFDLDEGAATTRRLTMELNAGKCNKIKLFKVENNDTTYPLTSTQVYMSQKK